ncbi:MAG: hemerythrin domain-containing protein [Deltaproteobacteria bacterium]|nr:hemerythrin domain-containing protein [Deltaproteobacteria bacterium]MBW2360605.1 hemerythrin domain-containing protein [Deltaproteobacteria bacterium]
MPTHVELHDQLVAHGHALAGRLGRLEGERAHQDSLHASVGSVRPARPALDGLIVEMREELAHVETTLHRMAVGTFGLCAGCGAEIPGERLATSPHTEHCDACESPSPAPSLAEVSAQHTDVRRLFASILDLVDGIAADDESSQGSSGRAGAALTLLADLENELTRHFALEERGRFLAEAVAAAPHLTSRATALEAEHASLQRAAAEISEAARQAGRSHPSWRALRRRLGAFSLELLRHEDEENALIAHAWLDDEGGGG